MNNDSSHILRIGTWLSIGSPVIAELAAQSGFHWVLMDLEHGCESEAALPNQLRALRGSGTRAIVRVGAPHADLIARVLDWDADGVMVPHVESAEEAQAIVRAAYYPPLGRRGVSRTVRAYDYGLNPPSGGPPRPLILAQIETVAGVEQAEEVAKVDGVDALFVGPADLQFDLRHGSKDRSEEFASCLAKVVAAAASAGKSAGILVREADDLEVKKRLGFTWIAVESDLSILRKVYQQTLAGVDADQSL
jgi:2-dehydro-3-deoxyglucarate aldolase